MARRWLLAVGGLLVYAAVVAAGVWAWVVGYAAAWP